jgi:hypothetical protein
VPASHDIQRIVADAGVALLVALVVALVLASFGVAGIINLTLAIILLILAWVVSVFATFVLPHIWAPSNRDRVIFSGVLAALLTGIGLIEFLLQPSEPEHYSRFQIEDILPLAIGDDDVWYINYIGYNRGNEPFYKNKIYWSFQLVHSVLCKDSEDQHIEALEKSQGPISAGGNNIKNLPWRTESCPTSQKITMCISV